MGEGFEALAAPIADDRVDVPGGGVDRVATPRSVEELGEVVRAAGEAGVGLLPMGGRTRLHLANPSKRVGLGLSLAGLSEVDEFEPDEGVVHALAGTPLATLRARVAEEGWELPLDAAGSATTVGGVIATAASGPRELAFGPVRDAILGLEVVGADGVETKCGGRVVKNVTGYDLARLHCGAFGTLGIVTGAWLRLRPAPAAREMRAARVAADRARFEALREVAGRPGLRALVWREKPEAGQGLVFAETGGSEAAVADERAALDARATFSDCEAGAIDDERESRLDPVPGPEGGVSIRARVLGTKLFTWKEAALGEGLSVSVDLGLGVVQATGALDSPEPLRALRAQAEDFGGFATFERLPAAWRDGLDVFGDLGGTTDLVAAIQRNFDPGDVLNPGRFVRADARFADGGPSS